MKPFAENRAFLEEQYELPFDPASGWILDEIKTDFERHCHENLELDRNNNRLIR